MKKLSVLLLVLTVAIFSSCTKKANFTEKVLNIVVSADVKGFDPIYANDGYSGTEVARVYEGLLSYHYLKRPYVLQPNLVEAMPAVSSNGLTYTFTLKKGIKFHDNECFPSGKGREMVASDVVYSFMRVADPKLQSTGWWVVDGKIKGLNEWRDAMVDKKSSDYRSEIAGVKATGKYTVEFTLNKAFPQFLYSFAMTFYYVVPREAVDFYGKEFVNHPVGTGAFTLSKYERTKTIVYNKNPTYRDKFYPTEGAPGDKEKGLLVDAGKKLPLTDKLVIKIITETQPRWLNFLKGKLDLLVIPKDNFDKAVSPDESISGDLANKGMVLDITPGIDVTYTAFNHSFKVFSNVKLRRAMSLALDISDSNKKFYNNQGLPAQSIVPPGIAGYDKEYVSPYGKYDIAKAKKLLAEAGYPGGKGLEAIKYEALSSTQSRHQAEFFQKSMAKIGITIDISTNTWPQMTTKIKNKTAMMWGISWLADYPDAENFLQLMYGPNKSPGANGSNYDNKEFNSLFKKAALLQHSPARTAIYRTLMKHSAENVPWIFGVHRKNFTLIQGWLPNYKEHAFRHGMSQYFKVDLNKKKELFKKI
jgi:oligopeptide transport system substrate-binding protein